MPLQASLAVRNSQLDQIEVVVGASPTLRLYSGAATADIATAPNGAVVCQITLPADWMAAASAGAKGKAGLWQGVGAAAAGAGTNAVSWRIYDAAGTVAHLQGNCVTTLTGATGELQLNSLNVAQNQVVTVSAFDLTAPHGPVAPPASVFSIVATSADKPEGSTGTTPFTFTISRTDTSQVGSVDWTVSGTGVNAANAADVSGGFTSQTESFAIGQGSRVVTVNILGDVVAEPDESFVITLSNAVNGTIGTGTAFGTIRDDDSVFVWPNASNTGVPAGTTLTVDSAGGEFFTSSVGQIIQDIDFTNRAVQIVHDNVVMRRCRLTSAGVWYGIWINGASNVTVEDCEINGNGPAVNSQGIVIDGSGAILRRNNVHHCGDGIIPGQGGTITYNYIHDPDGFGVFPDNPHADTFQCQGGQTGNLIQDNWISIRHQNGARGDEICNAGIYFTANGVPISNNIIDHNVIDPGQAFYCVYSNDNSQYAPGPNPASTVTGQQFTNNYFMDGTRTTAGSVHVPDQGSEAHILLWTNNRHFVTNAVLPVPGHVIQV